MFLSRNKKNNIIPVNPSFTIYKWGLRVSILYRYVFVMLRFDPKSGYVWTLTSNDLCWIGVEVGGGDWMGWLKYS